MAAAFEELARGVEVAAHAKVEVGLALAADGRREVEHGLHLAQRQRARGELLAQVAQQRLHARIKRQVGGRRHAVYQHQALDGLRGRAGQRQAALRQQGARQARAEEAASAGDEDVHGELLVY